MPDHWQATSLGEVARVVSERVDPTSLDSEVYVGLEHLGSNDRKLSMWGSTSDVSSSTTPFLAGDTLFGRLRPYLRKGCIAPFAGVCSPEILVIRRESGIDPQFLGLVILSDAVFAKCDQLSAGSRMPRTSAKDLMALSVQIPPPAEQQRIVDVVGSIDSCIDSLRTQVEATHAARSALLADLLSSPGDDWRLSTLGEVAQVVAGGTPRTGNPAYWNGQVVWVTPTEVVANNGKQVFNSTRKLTEAGLRGSAAKLLPVDTVLLTSRATIGAVALAGVPLATNQGFASLVCGGDVLPKFIMYWCQANKQQFVLRAGGNTFLEISRKKVAEIPIEVPSSAEQRRIVDLVESFDEQIASLESQIDSAQSFRSGVLFELLSGERILDESFDSAISL